MHPTPTLLKDRVMGKATPRRLAHRIICPDNSEYAELYNSIMADNLAT
jgi:hypothetical protein